MRGQHSARRWRQRSRLASLALAATLTCAPVIGATAPVIGATAPVIGATAPAASPDSSSDAERKQAARAQVQAGSAAFGAGEFALAIDHYEAAIALLPAPKLHYNLGVCHQRLSLSAETPEQRTRQRDLAIESYNAYLEQNPRAEDRLEVAATIRKLGGTPVTMPTLMPLFEGDEDLPAPLPDPDPNPDTNPAPNPAPNPLEDSGSVVDAATPQPTSERPYPHHGRFGLAFAGGYSPTMHAAAAIDGKGMIALDLHGGGFVGPRRRLLLAAHTGLYSGAGSSATGLTLSGFSLGLLGLQTWVVGREALTLGVGGVVALTGQGLDIRAGSVSPACRSGDNARIASRTGALLAPRFELGILLGARRRGMIAVLVQPGFSIFADGRSGTGCEAGETPWTSLGVRRRWQFQLWAGAGFNFRF